jgi:hypothetical protein
VSASVINLADRRPRASACCPHHALAAIADRVRVELDAHEGALLVDWPAQQSLLHELLAGVTGALAKPDGRVRP